MSFFKTLFTTLFAGLAVAGEPMPEVDVTALHAAIEAKEVALVLDVRTPAEFAQGHVPGAMNLPLDQVTARMGELEAYKGKPIMAICRSGARSARATSALRAGGYDVTNVAGGTMAWISKGYKVAK